MTQDETTATIAIDDLARHRVRKAFAAYRDAEKTAGQRRYELGTELATARQAWPQRGPNARGWGEFLASEGIDQDVALKAMSYAGWVDEDPDRLSRLQAGNPPTRVEAGIDPPPEVEIDRDTWCTPRWLTEALGPVDLDPCANERSHVQARSAFMLEERGEDGLALANTIGHDWRVFVNPPYSDVRPWIAAYRHTRFCFLLKLDPSTKWFAELYAATARILLPRSTRVQFEAPPGVPPEKALANQFPHALFFARAGDAPTALVEQCFDWITTNTDTRTA